MSAYRMTAARRAALKKAQLASARKRKRGMSTKKKVAIATAAVVGVAAGGYALDRKYNTMTIYHRTYHHRARKIAAEGFKANKHRARAYRNMVDGVLHEKDRAFFSTSRRGANGYGKALLTARVRKRTFYKYATKDVHPMSIKIQQSGGIAPLHSTHYHVNVADLKKAGIKLKYKYGARIDAKNKISNSYHSWRGQEY